MKKKSKVTKWYRGDIKPVHVGWYQREYINHDEHNPFSYWNGRWWSFANWRTYNIIQEHPARNGKSGTQDLRWRGVQR